MIYRAVYEAKHVHSLLEDLECRCLTILYLRPTFLYIYLSILDYS